MEHKYELIVVGGGFAGVCAALSAAKGGVDVLLVEKYNCLGGAAANALIMPFMRYWTTMPETNKDKPLCGNIFLEIVNEMRLLMDKEDHMEYPVDFDEEILKLVLNRMMLKYGVKLLFNTIITKAHTENGNILSLKGMGKSAHITLFADNFIDATGDAELSALAGCSFKLGRDTDNLCQPMTDRKSVV